MLFGTWSQAHAYDPSDYMETRKTEGESQALVGVIPFCGKYPGPRFDDKFRSSNQMDGISIADGGKMADSYFINKKTCKILFTYTGKSASSDCLYFCQILDNERRQ